MTLGFTLPTLGSTSLGTHKGEAVQDIRVGDRVCVTSTPFEDVTGVVIKTYGHGPHSGITILAGEPGHTVKYTFTTEDLRLLEGSR